MSSAPNEDDVAAVRELIDRSNLVSIEYHEVSARATGPGPEGETRDVNVEMGFQRRISDDSFGFRLNGEFITPTGEATIAVAVNYEFQGEQPDLRTILAFGNEVGIMTLFPYFREALSTITVKVFGEPIILPLLERGEIAFDLDLIEE